MGKVNHELLCVAEAVSSWPLRSDPILHPPHPNGREHDRDLTIPPSCARVIANMAADGIMTGNERARFNNLTDIIDDTGMTGLFKSSFRNAERYVWRPRVLRALTRKRGSWKAVLDKLKAYKAVMLRKSQTHTYEVDGRTYTGIQLMEMMRREIKRSGMRMSLRPRDDGLDFYFAAHARKGRRYPVREGIVFDSLDYCIAFVKERVGINPFSMKK